MKPNLKNFLITNNIVPQKVVNLSKESCNLKNGSFSSFFTKDMIFEYLHFSLSNFDLNSYHIIK